jgi:hypothetical protein
VARLLHQKLAVVELLGGRLRAIAELNTPLDAGQLLRLKVTATTPRLTLQTLATTSTHGGAAAHQAGPASLIQLLDPSQVRRLIGELETLAAGLKAASGTDSPQVTTLIASLERLTGHLTPLDLRGEPEATAARLLAHVRDGGLFFEQKLTAAAQATAAREGKPEGAPPTAKGQSMAQAHALLSDLKPHLQRLLVQLPALMEMLDPGQQLTDEGGRLLWTTVTGLLEEIDAGHKQLTEQRPDKAFAILRHSMWIDGHGQPLHFNVHLPRKGGGRKKDSAAAPMVSLLLDLRRFGTLRVDVRERPSRDSRQLTVNFWTQTEAVREDLETVGAPLTKILEHLYPEVALKIALAPDRIAAFEKANETPRNGQSDRGRLDIRV